jgi:hypothetical protein
LQAEATDTGTASASEDGEEYTSYGTNESDEDAPLVVPHDIDAQTSSHSLGALKKSIADLEAGQAFIVQKLEGLEKLLRSVNEDVMWVRGDVGLVHETVEKLGDAVSMYSNTVALVDGVEEGPSPPMPTWGTWSGKDGGKEGDRAERTSFIDERAAEAEEERSYTPMGQDADSLVLETQLFDVNTDMHAGIISLAEEGEPGGWQNAHDGGLAMSSPPATQNRVEVESDALEGGYTQMDLTCDVPQSTPMDAGERTWASFEETVREMAATEKGGSKTRDALVHSKPVLELAALVEAGSNTSDGWVQSKRGRPSSSEVGGQESTRSMLNQSGEHTSFNLNLSPPNVESWGSMEGGGTMVGGRGRGPGSRGGGRGAARGTGRGKRPPLVHPRYTSKASVPT